MIGGDLLDAMVMTRYDDWQRAYRPVTRWFFARGRLPYPTEEQRWETFLYHEAEMIHESDRH